MKKTVLDKFKLYKQQNPMVNVGLILNFAMNFRRMFKFKFKFSDIAVHFNIQQLILPARVVITLMKYIKLDYQSFHQLRC